MPVETDTKLKKNQSEFLEQIDKLIAGHLKELRQPVLLDETLIVWQFNSRDYCLNIISFHIQNLEDAIFLFDRYAVIITLCVVVTVFF